MIHCGIEMRRVEYEPGNGIYHCFSCGYEEGFCSSDWMMRNICAEIWVLMGRDDEKFKKWYANMKSSEGRFGSGHTFAEFPFEPFWWK